MQTFKLICLLALLLFVGTFTYQNAAAVELKFLFWSMSMSSSLLMLATLCLGIVIGWALSFLPVKRKGKEEKDI